MPEPIGDVVVLLPGIGGSQLVRKGRKAWAVSPGAFVRGLLGRGSTIRELTLTDDPLDADDLGDGVEVAGLVPDLHICPGIRWPINGYTLAAELLTSRLGLQPGRNFFEFPYDWRRDVRVAARQLQQRARGWLDDWRATANDDAKLVLVGHSLGGLVARTYLELFDGWKDTRHLITYGTPYSGSVNILDFLCNGFRPRFGPVAFDLSSTIRSFTSVYQLLPSYRCIQLAKDVGTADPPLFKADEVELPGLDNASRQKVAGALAFHQELRDSVDRHRQSDYERTGGYDLRPIVGDLQPTRQSAVLEDNGVTILTSRGGRDEGGDRTVPKISAVPHELLDGWVNTAFFSEGHGNLQNLAAVLDHVAGVIRARQVRTGHIFPAGMARLSLDVEDLYVTDEPVEIGVIPDFEPVARLVAEVTPAAGGETRRVPLQPRDDAYVGVVAGLPDADYRIVVGGELDDPGAEPDVVPVSGSFSVVDLERVAAQRVS
jgi:pimeloyl-ACP methyl ester carboxylesterase